MSSDASPRRKQKRAPPPIPVKSERSSRSALPVDNEILSSPTKKIPDALPTEQISDAAEQVTDDDSDSCSKSAGKPPGSDDSNDEDSAEEEPNKPQLTKREMVLREMVYTEEAYVKSLNTLINDYQKPLKEACAQGKPIVAEKNLNLIFGDIGLITTFNEKLLSELKVTTPDRVGKLFRDFAPFLKMYTAFVDFSDQAIKIVNEEMKRERNVMDKLMMSVDRDAVQTPTLKEFCAGKRETLGSLLIKPVQRVPRYRLLLEEFLKQTSADAPDRGEIEQALAQVQKAAMHCNEHLRYRQQEQEMLTLHMRFEDQKMLPWDSASLKERKIIKEGIVRKVDRKGGWRNNVMVLFNDYVCYGKGSFGGEVQFSQVMDLRAVLCDPLDVFLDEVDVFQLSAPQKSFVLHSDERDDWVSCIRKAIEARRKLLKLSKQPSFQVAPVWAPDTKACALCDKVFSVLKVFGVKRHHCRRCGRCVCQECSAGRWKLPHINKEKLLRMCDVCFDDVITAINGRLEPQTDGGRLLGLDPEDGEAISARYEKAWYPAECISSNGDGMYEIRYKSNKLNRNRSKLDDGSSQHTHLRSEVRTPTDLEVQRHLFRRERKIEAGTLKAAEAQVILNEAPTGSISALNAMDGPIAKKSESKSSVADSDSESTDVSRQANAADLKDADLGQSEISTPPSPMRSSNIKSATLYKKGLRSMMWTPRYCVLTPTSLKYSHAVRRSKEGTIAFDAITNLQMGTASKQRYKDKDGRVKVFEISVSNEKNSHLFKCEDGAEASQWLKAIKDALKTYQEAKETDQATNLQNTEAQKARSGELKIAVDKSEGIPNSGERSKPPPPARKIPRQPASPTREEVQVPSKISNDRNGAKPKIPIRNKPRDRNSPVPDKTTTVNNANARVPPKIPDMPKRGNICQKPDAPARRKPDATVHAHCEAPAVAGNNARVPPKIPKMPNSNERVKLASSTLDKSPKPKAPTRDKSTKPKAPTRDKSTKPKAPTRDKSTKPKAPTRDKSPKPKAPTRDKSTKKPSLKKRKGKMNRSAETIPPRPISMKPNLAHPVTLGIPGANDRASASEKPPPLPTEPPTDWIIENHLDEFRYVLDELGADGESDLRGITLDDLQDPELGMLDTDITCLWNKIVTIRSMEDESPDAPPLPSEAPPPLPSEAPPPLPSEAPPPLPSEAPPAVPTEPLPPWD